MQPAKFSSVVRLVLLGCMAVLGIWVAASFSGGESGKPPSVAGVSQQELGVPAQVETSEPSPIRRATPTPRPDTPTPMPLQPAQPVNHATLGEIAPDLNTAMSEKAAVN